MTVFSGKNIVIGITGGIAAYKIPLLIRELKRLGAQVRVVLSVAAQQFVTPITLHAISGHPVHDDLFDRAQEASMGHIALARWADLVLIAPTTADCLARLAQGRADDLLTTVCLATQAPIFLAPAMNAVMWSNRATQHHLQVLGERDFHLLPVGEGEQACGEWGEGRMLEPLQIIEHIQRLWPKGALSGEHILITAGPTQEFLDPVRYLSNPSTGTMGYMIAQAALAQGATVTLVSGPTTLSPPQGARLIKVHNALEMYDAVLQYIAGQSVFIATAAVSDYRAAQVCSQKIKKSENDLIIKLIKNPDILKTVSALTDRPFCVGFAAETQDLIQNALQKLQSKKLDMVCVNDVSHPGVGFGTQENALQVLTLTDSWTLEKQSKKTLAREFIHILITQLLASRSKCSKK